MDSKGLFGNKRVFVSLTSKYICMKKKLMFAAGFLLIAWSVTSCDSLFKKCKFCKTVTYENGNVTNSGTETEYCGTDLVTKEATPDIHVGSLTTKVECR
jgi:hypothetical protein